MFCENCGKKITDNVKFCPECGCKIIPVSEPANLRCPDCGAELIPGSVFCENCGKRLKIQPEQAAERPQVAAASYVTPAVPQKPRVSSIPEPPPAAARGRVSSGKETVKKKKSGCFPFLVILLVLISAGGFFYLKKQYGNILPLLKYAVSEVTGSVSSVIEKELIQLPAIDIQSFFKKTPDPFTNPTNVFIVQHISTREPELSTATAVPVYPTDERESAVLTTTQVPVIISPADTPVIPGSVPIIPPTATSSLFMFPTLPPMPARPTSVPESEDAYYYENFRTSEYPRQADFLWVTEDILNGNLPAGRIRLKSILSLMGGWKVYIVDAPENRFGSGMERLCNADLDAGQFGPQIAFHWYYVYNRDTKEVTKDFSPDSVYSGTWNDGQMEALGPGRVEIRDFYYLDGKEYAVGTIQWPDGIKGAVFMVRP